MPAMKQRPRRSIEAVITAKQELERQLDEDAERTRPRSPQFSQAGPSALTLYDTKLAAWRKAKAVELARRQQEFDRARRPEANTLQEILGGRR